MLRHFMALLTLLLLSAPGLVPVAAHAQGADTPAIDRSATGGAQTLEDIMRRQRGETIDDSFRSDNIGGNAVMAPGLGPLGGASDPELWRALRYNKADVTVSTGDDVGKVLMTDGGLKWLTWREGRLQIWGFWMVVGTAGGLLAFFLLRGRIRIDGELTGRTVTRFKAIERFGHWLLGISFLVLGATGLFVLFGRKYLAPVLGKEFNANLLAFSKVVHNNVAWAFMLGLIMVFVMWVVHNIPNRSDITWLRQYGGIIGSAHPPAKKFNAGQKMIFWSVVIFGAVISITGLSLLFPYRFVFLADVYALMNDWGLMALVGLEERFDMTAQEQMQMAQAWHAMAAFILMMIVTAHVYIGSIGMEGAFDAMGTGEVDEAWAHQHHSIWLDEVKAAEAGKTGEAKPSDATPAE
ncbi:formate dehydrogenase subunit gamma [Shimia biformata]|uniref:formate dehydrogenase subunit gamma n=1 Tax=Shimia biformata TaxID=1294299 RepID=UPI001950B38D|nr:formate dehydrogenase subunit gamma [Shimia biformata]